VSVVLLYYSFSLFTSILPAKQKHRTTLIMMAKGKRSSSHVTKSSGETTKKHKSQRTSPVTSMAEDMPEPASTPVLTAQISMSVSPSDAEEDDVVLVEHGAETKENAVESVLTQLEEVDEYAMDNPDENEGLPPMVVQYEQEGAEQSKHYMYFSKMRYDSEGPRPEGANASPMSFVCPDGTVTSRVGACYGNTIWGNVTLGGTFAVDKVSKSSSSRSNGSGGNKAKFLKNDKSARRQVAIGQLCPKGIMPTPLGTNSQLRAYVLWMREMLAQALYHHHRHQSILWKILWGKDKDRYDVPATGVWDTVRMLADADLIADATMVSLGLTDSEFSERFLATTGVFVRGFDGPPLDAPATASPFVRAAAELGGTLNLTALSKVGKDGVRYRGDHFYGERCYRQERFGGTAPDVEEESAVSRMDRLNSVRLDQEILYGNSTVIPGVTMQIRVNKNGKIAWDNQLQCVHHFQQDPVSQFKCEPF
jgi:hypothetical protein